MIYYMLTFITLNAYLLAYLIAGPSTYNEDSIPNCGAQVLCEAHIQHFKVNHKGMELKSVWWRCGGTTSVREFERGMEHLKSLNEEAWKYLADIEPRQWTRSHFSPRALTDCLVNNLSESFNFAIVKAKDKPILSML